MTFNDLLDAKNVARQEVLVLRHSPQEPLLNRALRGLATEKPTLFNAYQQTQSKKVKKQMLRAKYVASFIGHEPAKALFVGLYKIGESKPLTREQYWQVQEHNELKEKFGMKGFIPERDSRSSIIWFDLQLEDFYVSWIGKLIVK